MQKNILDQINDFLIKHWDPIGIGHDPNAYDEYRLYVKDIYYIIKNSNSYENLFVYLRKIENENMGLEIDEKKTKIVAQTLFNNYKT